MWSCSSYILIPGLDEEWQIQNERGTEYKVSIKNFVYKMTTYPPGQLERAQNELYLMAKSMQALEVMEYEQDLPSFTTVKEYNQQWTLEIPRELLDTL